MCSFIKAHRQERAVPGTGNGLWRGHGGRGALGHNGSRSEEDEGWGWQARVTSEEQTDLGQEQQVPKPWVWSWPWPWHWVNYKRREWASIEVAEWRKAKGSAQELPASQLAANPDWLIKRRLKMDRWGLLLACLPASQSARVPDRAKTQVERNWDLQFQMKGLEFVLWKGYQIFSVEFGSMIRKTL